MGATESEKQSLIISWILMNLNKKEAKQLLVLETFYHF